MKSPWWRTNWVRATTLFFVFGSILGWHRARLTLVRKQNVVLEQKVVSRTAALEDANHRTDPLTGVPNRRHYIERAELELAKLRRTGRPLTIGFADIDDFKQVNDDLGHELGDRVLKSVAELLRDPVRAQDVVARWGGEEFIILFPETNAAGAVVVAEKIRARVESTVLAANGRCVTVTIGLAEVVRPVPLEESIARADHALYEGKRQGKNCVVVAPPDEESPASASSPKTRTEPMLESMRRRN